jgi:hypothetical protein
MESFPAIKVSHGGAESQGFSVFWGKVAETASNKHAGTLLQPCAVSRAHIRARTAERLLNKQAEAAKSSVHKRQRHLTTAPANLCQSSSGISTSLPSFRPAQEYSSDRKRELMKKQRRQPEKRPASVQFVPSTSSGRKPKNLPRNNSILRSSTAPSMVPCTGNSITSNLSIPMSSLTTRTPTTRFEEPVGKKRQVRLGSDFIVRRHTVNAQEGIPHHLLTRMFLQKSEGNLVSDPNHTIGEPVSKLDLSMWHLGNDENLHLFLKQNTHAVSMVCNGCYELGDSGMQIIANDTKRLQLLEVRNCHNITDEGLSVIASVHNMHLESIDFSNCPYVTDEGIRAIARCNSLVSLVCDCNSNITDLSLFEIATCLKKLEKLSVLKCPNLTDDGMRRILLECKSLTNVAFGNSHILGEAFVMISIPGTVMPTALQELQTLNLSNCTHLMDNGLTW